MQTIRTLQLPEGRLQRQKRPQETPPNMLRLYGCVPSFLVSHVRQSCVLSVRQRLQRQQLPQATPPSMLRLHGSALPINSRLVKIAVNSGHTICFLSVRLVAAEVFQTKMPVS